MQLIMLLVLTDFWYIPDDDQNGTTRHDAKCLAASMGTLENAFMADFWNVVLTRYNDTSMKLQSTTCDLKLAIDLLESLHTFTNDLRERFDEFEIRAIDASGNAEYLSVVSLHGSVIDV